MGFVMTPVKLTNLGDYLNARTGLIPPEDVRGEEVQALVDTGASRMVLPIDLIRRLGLEMVDRERVRVADGRAVELDHFIGVLVEVLGRRTPWDVLAAPEGTTPLLSVVQLEALDLIVDPNGGEVRPRHPDGPRYYLLAGTRGTPAVRVSTA